MRAFLADDQAEVRAALGILLEHALGARVVGEAADAETLAEAIRSTRPDVLLLDWGLVEASARGALAELRARRPGLAVVVISGRVDAREPALAAGADAFVGKTDSPEKLLATLRGLQSRPPALVSATDPDADPDPDA